MVDITKEVKVRSVIRSKWNKALYKGVTHQSYWNSIPLKEMMDSLLPLGVHIIQEDGDDWCGFICGESGSCQFQLGYDGGVVSNSVLVLNWFGEKVHGLKGKVEINSYIS